MKYWRAYDPDETGDRVLVSVEYELGSGVLRWWHGPGPVVHEVSVSHLRQSGLELSVTATDGSVRVWWGVTESADPWFGRPTAKPPHQ